MKRIFCLLTIGMSASFLLQAQSVPLRPPITGIAKVSVYASDISQSRQFYGNLLGLSEVAGGPTLRYRINAFQSVEVEPLPNGETDDLAYVGFATSNVKALRIYLRSRNVPVEGDVHSEADGSQTLWVKDPEGHRIQFVQLPAHGRVLPVGAMHPAAQSEQPLSHHILHAGFIVHDRDAEDHFFGEVLGFREGWQGGMKDDKTDWIDMQVPNGTDWIEYMMHGTGPITAEQSGVMNHFALGVLNIQQAASALEQRGWHATPRQKAQLGRDGKWQLNLYDPNGTRVELMEFRPVQTPCCAPYTLHAPAPAPR